jgi:fibronectin type 3 domain-containing protein
MNLRYIKKPKTVKNLKRSDATMKTITLSWDKVPYVYGYKIYRLNKETGEYEYLAAVRGSGHTSYTDKNVKVNTMYSYKVCAYYKLANGNYTGNFSDVLNALPDQKPIENISFSKATDTSLKISWDKETEVTGYRITRYNSKTGKYETVATIKSADTTSYTDTGLASGTTYKYKVRAYYEEDGVRAYFNNSDSKSHSTLPGVITGITATKNTNNSVTLTWNKQDIVTGYRLYMLDSATGTWNKIATIKDSGTNTYTVTGLKSNKKYEFSLIAYYTVNKKSGTTKRSDTYTTYTAPAEVKGITGTPVSNKKVKISWTPAKNVTGYYVYLKDTATNKWTKVATIDDKNVDSYTHSGLKANTSYSFRVKAYRKVNNATYTGTAVSVDVSTKTSAVKNVSIRKHGTKYMLTWNTQKSASGYYIYKYNPKTKKYTRLAKIKGASNNIYIVSKAQSSKCKYVIASYVTYNGKNYKGAYSEYADTVKKSASCTVAGNLINIRSGAGTKYAVTTTVKKGTNLKITNVTYSGNTSWYKVTFTQNGKTVTGYILSDYVDITFK